MLVYVYKYFFSVFLFLSVIACSFILQSLLCLREWRNFQ